MGNQEATVRGTGLARAVPAGAVTMRRRRRPRSRAAIGTGAIRVVPTAHSCDLRIGVDLSRSRMTRIYQEGTLQLGHHRPDRIAANAGTGHFPFLILFLRPPRFATRGETVETLKGRLGADAATLGGNS